MKPRGRERNSISVRSFPTPSEALAVKTAHLKEKLGKLASEVERSKARRKPGASLESCRLLAVPASGSSHTAGHAAPPKADSGSIRIRCHAPRNARLRLVEAIGHPAVRAVRCRADV
jgi:hypothetical protein